MAQIKNIEALNLLQAIGQVGKAGSIPARYALAVNLNRLKAVATHVEELRKEIVSEALPEGESELKPDHPSFENVMAQIGELMDQSTDVELMTIKATELREVEADVPVLALLIERLEAPETTTREDNKITDLPVPEPETPQAAASA